MKQLLECALSLSQMLSKLPLEERVTALNAVRRILHESSPFSEEPVDLVEWVPGDTIQANDYNPNKVAPPEMKLLEHSIVQDGYTQPIVTHTTEQPVVIGSQNWDKRDVVDGFHRNRVGKESPVVKERVKGYLPVVSIRAGREAKADRMASTVRHNRARGVHGVAPMTDLVAYLAKKGWDDAKIGKELGMDQDEVLRFRQISGLTELFQDQAFSEAWDLTDSDDIAPTPSPKLFS